MVRPRAAFREQRSGRLSGRCIECLRPRLTDEQRRERARVRARQRTPEQRRAIRKREAERKGKSYKAREQWAKESASRKASERMFVEMRKTWRAWRAFCNQDITEDHRNRLDREKYKRRYMANPGAEIARTKRAKFRRRAMVDHPESASASDLAKMRRSARTCAYCHADIQGKVHIDHFYPLVSGGSNRITNLVASCRTCNARKGVKVPAMWHGTLSRDGWLSAVTVRFEMSELAFDGNAGTPLFGSLEPRI